jgi:hypothetical protein
MQIGEIRDRIMSHEGPDIRDEVLALCDVVAEMLANPNPEQNLAPAQKHARRARMLAMAIVTYFFDPVTAGLRPPLTAATAEDSMTRLIAPSLAEWEARDRAAWALAGK